MATLGSPITNKFPIGTAELRLGDLSAAGQLLQSHSVGVVDEATVTASQETVKLLGGFPQKTIASSIISQESSVTATLREGSRRNLSVMLGEGVPATATDVSSLIVADEILAATPFDVTASEGTNFATDDLVVIYVDGKPDTVQHTRVVSVATDTVTISPGLAIAVNGTTETVHVFHAKAIAIGGITQTNYFAASLVQAEQSTGRPVGFNFWKTSVAGSMDYATNATDFASFSLELDVLEPAASEYGVGQDLEHLADIIPNHPVGMYIGGGD